MKTEYHGIGQFGTRGSFRVTITAGSRQWAGGTYRTIEEALEVYNNGAYYLNLKGYIAESGKPIYVPLQGPSSDAYNAKLCCSQSDFEDQLPPATPLTEKLLKWAEENFIPASDKPQFLPQSSPKIVAQRLNEVVGAFAEYKGRINSDLASMESRLHAMLKVLDPKVIAAARDIEEYQKLVALCSGPEYAKPRERHLQTIEAIYAEFPFLRP